MSRSTPSTAVVVPNRRIRPWVVMAEADPVVGGVAGSTYLTVFDILISILYTDGQSNERHPRTPHAGASAAADQGAPVGGRRPGVRRARVPRCHARRRRLRRRLQQGCRVLELQEQGGSLPRPSRGQLL